VGIVEVSSTKGYRIRRRTPLQATLRPTLCSWASGRSQHSPEEVLRGVPGSGARTPGSTPMVRPEERIELVVEKHAAGRYVDPACIGGCTVG